MMNIISKIGADKFAHFFGIGWLYLVLMLAFNDYTIAMVSCMVLSFSKEVFDSIRKNGTGFNVLDLLFSLAGLVTSVLIYEYV